MSNVNAFMNQYAHGERGRVDEGHPLYIAGYAKGINEGRELEREQQRQKNEWPHMAVKVSVTDMDIFYDLLKVTRDLFDHASEEQQLEAHEKINELIGATHDISEFNNREERRE